MVRPIVWQAGNARVADVNGGCFLRTQSQSECGNHHHCEEGRGEPGGRRIYTQHDSNSPILRYVAYIHISAVRDSLPVNVKLDQKELRANFAKGATAVEQARLSPKSGLPDSAEVCLNCIALLECFY
jgi:hypothetical protein